MSSVSVVIPALNEEEPIADVVKSVIATGVPQQVIVVDNGSTDATGERAAEAGAKVVIEPNRGYGRACAAGISSISPNCDIFVFVGGDGSDCPEFMSGMIEPIRAGTHDFVIGSRARGNREPG